MFHTILLEELLNQVLQAAAAPSITGPFVISLHTGAPGTTRANEVGTGVWTNYVRQTLVRSGAGFDVATDDGAGGRESLSAALVDFGTAAVTGTAPVISHYEVWDSAGSPRRIFGDTLPSPMTINNGNPVSVPIGDIVAAFIPV